METQPSSYLGTQVALANLDCLRENAQSLYRAGVISEDNFVNVMRSLSRQESMHELREQISVKQPSWPTTPKTLCDNS
jgi:hypothetical protein